MRMQWSIGVMVLLAVIVVGGGSPAFGWDMGRLARFTARQNLRDEVCVAMADGVVTQHEKAEILGDAKKVLTAEEMPAFQRLMDRLCPTKQTAKHAAIAVKNAKKTRLTTANRTATVSSKPKTGTAKQASSAKKPKATQPAVVGPSLIIPTTALLPDRVVSGVVTR